MDSFITRIKTNLNGVLHMTQMIDGIMMTGDDRANKIIVELHRDHVPFEIPSGSKIVGYFIRADGATLELEGSVGAENNEVVVVIPDLAYQVPGALSIAIRMFIGPYDEQQRGYYDSETGYFVIEDDPSITVGPHGEIVIQRTAHLWQNKTVIASASCYVQMTETNSIIEPGHVIPDINDVIAKLAELDQSESGRVAAEASRVTAESARASAETARVFAENARKSAETVRASAETARASAETTRVSAENIRKYAETARETAEAARAASEATRRTNEIARQNAIQNMSVSATPRAYNQNPTAIISDVNGHKHIEFGLVQGHPFVIKKSFPSIAAMEAYIGSDVVVYDFVIIASTVEDPDNSKLYMKNASNGWTFITDLSGAEGIQGPQGEKGNTGNTGNGISSAAVDDQYRLNLGFTNGATYQSGSIRGPEGPQGDQGVKGDTGMPGAGLYMTYDDDTGAIVINITDAVSGNGVSF